MRRVLPYALLMFVLLPTAITYADSFVITDGTLGHSLLNGRGNFDFSGPGIAASGLIDAPFLSPPAGFPQVSPGSTIPSFSTRITELVSVPPSSFTVNGSPFSGTGTGYEFRINGGSFTLPSLLAPSATVEFPATFSGTLFQPIPTTPVHTLSGDVLASITFISNPGGSFTAQRFDAAFVSASASASGGSNGSAVIPEPTSMLLFGAGLAGIWGWRWRQATCTTS